MPVTETPSANTFQFAGRENDGTGLYYMRARYYSPALQRFISQDPIGFAGGINLYAYAGNNPVSLIDPLGMDPSGGGNWGGGLGHSLLPLLMLGLLALPVAGEIADGLILAASAEAVGEASEEVGAWLGPGNSQIIPA